MHFKLNSFLLNLGEHSLLKRNYFSKLTSLTDQMKHYIFEFELRKRAPVVDLLSLGLVPS